MSEMVMRYRMSERDAYYSGRVVNGARSITLMGDCGYRLMAKEFGNTGTCIAVPKSRLFNPVFPGDYIEFHARLVEVDGKRVTIETRCFKVAQVPEDRPFESSAEILEKPILCIAAMMVYELPA
jgi:3-aminobutyryl-CoA ammonia-lyase